MPSIETMVKQRRGLVGRRHRIESYPGGVRSSAPKSPRNWSRPYPSAEFSNRPAESDKVDLSDALLSDLSVPEYGYIQALEKRIYEDVEDPSRRSNPLVPVIGVAPGFTVDPTESEYYNAKKAFRRAAFAGLAGITKTPPSEDSKIYLSRSFHLSQMFPEPEKSEMENYLESRVPEGLDYITGEDHTFDAFVDRWLPSVLTNNFVSKDNPAAQQRGSVFSEWEPRRPERPRRKIKIATKPGLRCAYCHDTFSAGEIPHTCTGCRTMRHQACVEEGGVKCPTFGCPKRRSNPRKICLKCHRPIL